MKRIFPKVLPEPKNIFSSVYISIENKSTIRTIMNTNGQTFMNDLTASGARLGCILGRNFNNFFSSLFRFETKNVEEIEPRYISHRPVQCSIIFPKPHFFYKNCVVFFDKFIGNFKMKIFSLISYFFMNLRKKCFSIVSSIGANLSPRKLLLSFDKNILRSFEESGILDFVPIVVSQERFTTHIDTNFFTSFWKQLLRNLIAGKRNIPLSVLPSDSTSFDITFKGSVKFNLDFSNIFDYDVFINEFIPKIKLFKGETVKSISGFESWKSWFLFIFDSSKKVIISFIESFLSFLENLRKDFFKFWMLFFKRRQMNRFRFPSLIERIDSLSKIRIVEESTEIKPAIKFLFRRLIWIDFVFEGLFHNVHFIRQNTTIHLHN